PDSKVLLTLDSQLRLWDLTKGKSLGEPVQFPNLAGPYEARFSQNGKYLAVLNGAAVALVETATGKVLAAPARADAGFRPPLSGLTCGRDDKPLTATGPAGATLWETATGKELASRVPLALAPPPVDRYGPGEPGQFPRLANSPPNPCLSPDRRVLVTAGKE